VIVCKLIKLNLSLLKLLQPVSVDIYINHYTAIVKSKKKYSIKASNMRKGEMFGYINFITL
jgi:hypothetical protein